MTIEAIAALSASAVSDSISTLHSAGVAPNEQVFSKVLDSIEGLNQQIQTNEVAVQNLALGETDNLHQIMMNLERTRLTFDLMMQVRNKMLEGYQELMRMQV